MIDLTEAEIKRKRNDGWRETQGIKWRVVKANRNWQIQVVCPCCGRIGSLRRSNIKNMRGFVIVHSVKPHNKCRFGWTSEEYDILKKIYSTALEIYRIALG